MNGASSYSGLVDKAFMFILGTSVLLLIGLTAVMIYFLVQLPPVEEPEPRADRRQRHPGNPVDRAADHPGPGDVLLRLGRLQGHARHPRRRHARHRARPRCGPGSSSIENGKQSTELIVPTGRPVSLNLQSADVIHSFFVPAFRLKEDCMPGPREPRLVRDRPATASTTSSAPSTAANGTAPCCRWSSRSPPRNSTSGWAWTPARRPAPSADAQGLRGLPHHRRLQAHRPRLQGHVRQDRKRGDRRREPREITVDEEYIRKSILEPTADLVEGYQALMPPRGIC